MPGGGQHKVAPGQGTDDSELATSLMLGLIDQNIENYMKDQNCEIQLNMDKVCARYKDWYNSEPFDQGSTVRGALGALTRHWRELDTDWSLIIRESGARDIYKVAEAVNKQSKSNGSLMKICPIAIWAAEVIKNPTPENTKLYHDLILADARIIHSEELTGACIFVYSATIAFLLNNRHQANRAQLALDYATQLAEHDLAKHSADNGQASAKIWIKDAKELWDNCKKIDKGWIYNPKE